MKSSPTNRASRAVESFKSAADCIGTITPGFSVFALTRGQFSMIDAILAILDQTGPAALSIWSWTIADYEVQCLKRLQNDARVTSGTMIIDHGARRKNAAIIADWKATFGQSSVRYVLKAAENVLRNGAIVSHPRTASPIENPYLKIMSDRGKFLLTCSRYKLDRVMSLCAVPTL